MYLDRHIDSADDDSGKLGFLASACDDDNKMWYIEYNQSSVNESTPILRIRRINFTPPFDRKVSLIGSCNGLICLVSDQSICICNPITREYVVLPEINRDCDDGYDYGATSFGYVSSTNEFKVVGMYESRDDVEVHIYTLGSGIGWRNLGKFIVGYDEHWEEGLFANGYLYWMNFESEIIFSFDLAEEKFCENIGPPCAEANILGVLDGFLYSGIYLTEGSDISLLKEENVNHEKKEQEVHQSLVWSEDFSYICDGEFLATTKSDGVLTYSGKYFNIYDTKSSTLKRLVKFKDLLHRVFPHKNTLGSLKELGEADTKILESLEIEETKSRDYSILRSSRGCEP